MRHKLINLHPNLLVSHSLKSLTDRSNQSVTVIDFCTEHRKRVDMIIINMLVTGTLRTISIAKRTNDATKVSALNGTGTGKQRYSSPKNSPT
jgi:hypothetical protein